MRNLGITLVAGTLALASSVSAHAATTRWELTSGTRYIWLTSPEFPKGACIPSGGWHSAEPGSRISTVLFEAMNNCSYGAGTQCRSTVPSNPSIGYLRFDANTCEWIPMVTEPV